MRRRTTSNRATASRFLLSLDLVLFCASLIQVKTVSTHEAKTHLSRLLAEVEAGEEIMICRGKVPAAKLVSPTRKAAPRRPRVGTVTSDPVQATEDAFAPLDADDLASWGI